MPTASVSPKSWIERAGAAGAIRPAKKAPGGQELGVALGSRNGVVAMAPTVATLSPCDPWRN
jgi:hypothetical protein